MASIMFFFEASTNLSDLLKAVFMMFLYCFRPFSGCFDILLNQLDDEVRSTTIDVGKSLNACFGSWKSHISLKKCLWFEWVCCDKIYVDIDFLFQTAYGLAIYGKNVCL